MVMRLANEVALTAEGICHASAIYIPPRFVSLLKVFFEIFQSF